MELNKKLPFNSHGYKLLSIPNQILDILDEAIVVLPLICALETKMKRTENKRIGFILTLQVCSLQNEYTYNVYKFLFLLSSFNLKLISQVTFIISFFS